MADFNNIPLGLRVQTQIPLDVKQTVIDEPTLAYLGVSDNLAYTYYDRLKVTVFSNGSIWQWRQVQPGEENTGLVPSDFTYPSGVTIFGVDYSNKKYNFFRFDQRYDAVSVAVGQSIYNGKTTLNGLTTFKFKGIDIENTGDGEPILGINSNTGTDVTVVAKSIDSTNLDVYEEDGTIFIDTPTNPSDIKFYVNENYTGGGDDGSLAKPFRMLKDAFAAFIGPTGTIINPEYGGIGTIELLSSVTVDPNTGTGMTYLSVNNLKLNGNGFVIVYKGTQPYFISTEYLVSLCPLNPDSTLSTRIDMNFKNVTIHSITQHKMVYHLSYTSPTVSTEQLNSSMTLDNCGLYDFSYSQEESAYTKIGIISFGSEVRVQNTLPTDQYLIVNKDISWFGEGSFVLKNCRIQGSSSTILHNLNSSLATENITMNFSPVYVNYQTKDGSNVYSPRTGVYFILNEKNGPSGRAGAYLRIDGFDENSSEQTSGGSQIGGQDAFVKNSGNSYIEVLDGFFYGEKFNNVIQMDINSEANLVNCNLNSVTSVDTVKGAFKYVGTLPASQKTIGVAGSVIRNVKNWTDLSFIKPVAASAVINDADFSSGNIFASNAAALAGGLVPGNIYYNNSVPTNLVATKVI